MHGEVLWSGSPMYEEDELHSVGGWLYSLLLLWSTQLYLIIARFCDKFTCPLHVGEKREASLLSQREAEGKSCGGSITCSTLLASADRHRGNLSLPFFR